MKDEKMTPTLKQIERIQGEYSQLMQEPVKVEFWSGSTMYVFGSELACLRLHYKMQSGRVAFSDNLKTWYYSKEIQ